MANIFRPTSDVYIVLQEESVLKQHQKGILFTDALCSLMLFSQEEGMHESTGETDFCVVAGHIDDR